MVLRLEPGAVVPALGATQLKSAVQNSNSGLKVKVAVAAWDSSPLVPVKVML